MINFKGTLHKSIRMNKSNPPWIASRLCCGLGNRLFQLATAIGLAEKNNTRPILFLPAMQKVEHGNFELIRKLCPSLELVYTEPEWNILKEKSDSTVPTDSPILTGPTVLHGFFQNTANFPSVSNMYLPRLPVTPTAYPNAWAIHFRFGDYCVLPHHQIPELNKYYYHAIQSKIPKESPIILFSDSPERLPAIAEEIRSIGYHTTIYTNPDTYETLLEFSRYSAGSICSNSTFAWWAAFLTFQNNPEYKAYFPDRWIQGKPPPNIFTLPFTQVIHLNNISDTSYLKSFRF
jgi:hypothetical protein